MAERKYDSTVARIAGNLLSGMGRPTWDGELTDNDEENARWAVGMARAIVAETKRTEPVIDERPER